MDEPNDTQSLQLKSPGGWGGKLTGTHVFLFMIIVLLLGTIVWLMSFSLKSWGDPVPIKQTFELEIKTLDEHTEKMTRQHSVLTNAIRWNTYVNWVCSPMNISQKAKEKCTNIDLMQPDTEDSIQRR